MAPDEVVILCGEWETGPTPQKSSGEKYNVVLQVKEILRHPAFNAGGLGVEGGSDLALFKIKDQGLVNSSALEINPICLPDPLNPNPREGVQSGWANPPPLHYFREFGPGFLPFVTDTYKQWHYALDIKEECREPNTTGAFGLQIDYPSVAYFPPGLICANEMTHQFCPTAGDSGSPLMVKDSVGRYSIRGILSFHRGCDQFMMGAEQDQNENENKEQDEDENENKEQDENENENKTRFVFSSYTESPLAYTKLSLYLP